MVKEIVFDIEANGLHPDRVHCWAASGNQSGTTPESFQQVLNTGATLVGHNIIGYDIPVLGSVWGLEPTANNVIDTLVLSRLANPSRQGGHGLAAWGQRLGYPKVEHEDWSTYTPEMQHRCNVDVEINERVLVAVRKELKGFSQDSIDLEMEVAHVIEKQHKTGWAFDERKAFLLAARLRDEQRAVELEVQEQFRPLATKGTEVNPRYTKDGSLSKVGTNFLGDDWETLSGPCTKVTFPEFNLGSNDQIARYLKRQGWEPKTLTETGKAVVDEGALKGVDIPEAQLILRYKNLSKVAKMVEGWIEACQDDGRIYGRVNPCGAVTGRMTHSNPNLAQVPARGSLGKECRELFTVEPGYTLVGTDACGLELRCLAHYMNDEGYSKAVVEGSQSEGTDVHTLNQKAAGLPDRDTAKTFIYAFLYGAGDALIADIAGLKTAKEGKALKERFLRATPALASLKSRVEDAAGRGWLKGLDGRKVHVRSVYSGLNTLLQSAGAILMKRQMVILDTLVFEAGLDARQVATVHDEVQFEVADGDVGEFQKLAEQSMVLAGEYYNLRCPLAGEAKAGQTWKETH